MALTVPPKHVEVYLKEELKTEIEPLKQKDELIPSETEFKGIVRLLEIVLF